jgi:hypothetical protein
VRDVQSTRQTAAVHRARGAADRAKHEIQWPGEGRGVGQASRRVARGRCSDVEQRRVAEEHACHEDRAGRCAERRQGELALEATVQLLEDEQRAGDRRVEGHGEAGAGASRDQHMEIGPRRKRVPISRAPTAPICTLGPSGPGAIPPPIASRPPTNLMRSRRGSGLSPDSVMTADGIAECQCAGPSRCQPKRTALTLSGNDAVAYHATWMSIEGRGPPQQSPARRPWR